MIFQKFCNSFRKKSDYRYMQNKALLKSKVIKKYDCSNDSNLKYKNIFPIKALVFEGIGVALIILYILITFNKHIIKAPINKNKVLFMIIGLGIVALSFFLFERYKKRYCFSSTVCYVAYLISIVALIIIISILFLLIFLVLMCRFI